MPRKTPKPDGVPHPAAGEKRVLPQADSDRPTKGEIPTTTAETEEAGWGNTGVAIGDCHHGEHRKIGSDSTNQQRIFIQGKPTRDNRP